MSKDKIDLNESLIKKYIDSIRPENEEIRAQLDVGYSFDGRVAILFELRPFWADPKEIIKSDFAKIRYYKSKSQWNLYWMRASGKWEPYNPFPVSSHLEELIEVIENDQFGCFFG